jgi:hypothetical protein
MMDISRFEKVKQLYEDMTLDNTLKLLIRNKLSFEMRKKLWNTFVRIDEYEIRFEAFNYLLNIPS